MTWLVKVFRQTNQNYWTVFYKIEMWIAQGKENLSKSTNIKALKLVKVVSIIRYAFKEHGGG